MKSKNENNEYNDLPFDPEEIVYCPYYNEHIMPAKRLPYHLKKCYEVNMKKSDNMNRDMVDLNM